MRPRTMERMDRATTRVDDEMSRLRYQWRKLPWGARGAMHGLVMGVFWIGSFRLITFLGDWFFHTH